MRKYLHLISLVTPFVYDSFDTETSTFLLDSFEFGTQRPNLFSNDIYYSVVHNNTANARFLKDLLHDCSEGRLATTLFILFGNCVEEIAESWRLLAMKI